MCGTLIMSSVVITTLCLFVSLLFPSPVLWRVGVSVSYLTVDPFSFLAAAFVWSKEEDKTICKDIILLAG